MGGKTNIEWTDSTWSPIRARRIELQADGSGKEHIGWHCEHASEGCRNCYAERLNKRLGTGQEFKPAHVIHTTKHGDSRGDVTVFLDEEMLLQPLRWKRPRRIFVCSMTDAFADFVTDDMLDRLFAVMALSPQHTFQVLTKRAARMRAYMTHDGGFGRWGFIDGRARQILRAFNGKEIPAGKILLGPLPHVWLGVSVEDQPNADERILDLIGTPAAVRYLSVEPMLGSVIVDQRLLAPIEGTSQAGQRFIDWVICGGESGPGARPMHPDWARGLRDQCAAAGVPFLHKQNGEFASVSEVEGPGVHHTFADGATVRRVGKKAAGRLLDGVEHNGFPR